MARPRVFISSTFYDLRYVRADIERFVKDLGFEPVLNERGHIPYDKEDELEEACYREIQSCDILISIVGGRYGTASKTHEGSISQVELRTAAKLSKQIYIIIEKNVYSEYHVYMRNKDTKDYKTHFVDDPKIFHFIEFVHSLPKNNAIFTFDYTVEITSILREQWAGLFQRLLSERSKFGESQAIDKINKTAETLGQLVSYLESKTEKGNEAVKSIIMLNHPVFHQIKQELQVPYRIIFLDRTEMQDWLTGRGFNQEDSETENSFRFTRTIKKRKWFVDVSEELFFPDGRLIPFDQSTWRPELVNIFYSDIKDLDDDIPF